MRRIIFFLFLMFINANAIENLGTYGKVYKIAEEDILEWIKENAKIKPISKEQLDEKVEKSATMNLDMPVAKKDRIRKELITYEVKEDIVINGKLIAKKGTKINVLKEIKLNRTYVILADYMMPVILKDFPDLANDNTTFLITKGNIRELEKKYPDLYIYGGFPQIVKALKVEKIPSIVYQEDDELVIYEKGFPNAKKDTANTNK